MLILVSSCMCFFFSSPSSCHLHDEQQVFRNRWRSCSNILNRAPEDFVDIFCSCLNCLLARAFNPRRGSTDLSPFQQVNARPTRAPPGDPSAPSRRVCRAREGQRHAALCAQNPPSEAQQCFSHPERCSFDTYVSNTEGGNRFASSPSTASRFVLSKHRSSLKCCLSAHCSALSS